MGLKNSGHTGQRRVFFILDRATRKFNGDIGLWMQYLEFARKQKANKKLSQILTTVLRLHPIEPELWIYAAHYALDDKSDIIEARSSMQRGLRFCKHSKHLWCEYVKLEMIYISRVSERGRLLRHQRPADDSTITLPALDVDEVDSDRFRHIEKVVLEELQETPALSGAIPIAIFNAAMKEFTWDSDLGRQLFNVITLFRQVPCVKRILRHIVERLQDQVPKDPSTLSCFFKEPTSCVEVVSTDFSAALRDSLKRLKIAMKALSTGSSIESNAQSRGLLARDSIDWVLSLLQVDHPDEDITKALLTVLKKTWNQLLIDLEIAPGIDASEFLRILENFQEKKLQGLVLSGAMVGLRLWPENIPLSAFQPAAISCGPNPQ